MNEIIKGFQQFVNEGQGPAHSLLRDLHRQARERAKSGDYSRGFGNPDYKAEVTDRMNQLSPAERERFKAVGTRTAHHRSAQLKLDKMKSDPDGLTRLIDGYFNSGTGEWIAPLVDEFVSTDMTVDQLNAEIQKHTVTSEKQEEWIANVFKRKYGIGIF